MHRQAEQAARERIWYFDITLSSVYIFVLAVGLLLAIGEQECHGFRTWSQVILGFYIFDLIIGMNQLMHVKKHMHENIWLILCQLVMLLVFTGWYIYGNVIYYQNKDYCNDPKRGDAVSLT